MATKKQTPKKDDKKQKDEFILALVALGNALYS